MAAVDFITPETNARFDKFVEQIPFSSCWLWNGATGKGGYGRFKLNKILVSAHRYQYERHHGVIPDGNLVMHTCHNGSFGCVTPHHLMLGTQQDNINMAVRDNRIALGESNGKSKLTANQVRIIRLLVLTGLTQPEIGARYNVHPGNISNIKLRKHWKYI